MFAIAVLIIILARPQSTNSWQNSSTEGIDSVLAMDISTSMLAQDLKPNRLEASKDVASAFINGRPNDNIGLVVFEDNIQDSFSDTNYLSHIYLFSILLCSRLLEPK